MEKEQIPVNNEIPHARRRNGRKEDWTGKGNYAILGAKIKKEVKG